MYRNEWDLGRIECEWRLELIGELAFETSETSSRLKEKHLGLKKIGTKMAFPGTGPLSYTASL